MNKQGSIGDSNSILKIPKESIIEEDEEDYGNTGANKKKHNLNNNKEA
jgi:hypothetical protein